MDIRIGIANSAREISFETSQNPDEIEKAVSTALESEKYLKLSDDRGRLYIVPVASFSYLEIGAEETRRVGFVA
ncbi:MULTISPECIES: DUF3107 domain-containing protein [Schumannella]|uniref:DUF3107 domain-containing protein n=2 Tax=Schumannella TaxID=472058 RepID=A0A852YDX6_9MICO|nr:DUF3107 domain-containing protein [Schumannella soli]NYG99510.1 hypothetical protein [Schumannella luteola]TPW75859.1 DUF3107 domain-containing protein [Schumannella soli]TPX03833.1 DUF3107 domain-containing protein [Schumannella luteola]